ncbi:MAG: (Na+)-NQR maturation NqrM [Planctomycetaceae bacterium]|nr:(Na+)-NQR maturation NqrM [Planctomycetaceae bacterium]
MILAAIAAVVLGLVIAGMAVGVIFSNRRIKGSCGGLGNMRDGDGHSPCMACGGSPTDCDEVKQTECAVSPDDR